MKKTITKTIDGITYTATVDKRIAKNSAYADGYNVPLGTEARRYIYLSVEKGGKKAYTSDINFFFRLEATRPDGGYARLGDNYISQPVYDTLTEMLAAADAACHEPGYDEMVTKQADDLAKEQAAEDAAAQDIARRTNHPGWCNACESYCYGDCGSTG